MRGQQQQLRQQRQPLQRRCVSTAHQLCTCHAVHRAAGSPCVNMYFASGLESCFGHATLPQAAAAKAAFLAAAAKPERAQGGGCNDPQGLPDRFRGGAASFSAADGCTSRYRPHGTCGQYRQRTCTTDSKPWLAHLCVLAPNNVSRMSRNLLLSRWMLLHPYHALCRSLLRRQSLQLARKAMRWRT